MGNSHDSNSLFNLRLWTYGQATILYKPQITLQYINNFVAVGPCCMSYTFNDVHLKHSTKILEIFFTQIKNTGVHLSVAWLLLGITNLPR